MSDSIDFQFDDAHEMASRWAQAPQVAERELVAATNRLTLFGERTSKQLASVGRERGGTLRRAITAEPATFGGGTVSGRWGVSVRSKTGFPYHIPQEKGRRAFSAKPGKVLAFTIGGRKVFTRRVRAAKGRFYMRGGLNAVRPKVGPEYRGALKRIIASISGGG